MVSSIVVALITAIGSAIVTLLVTRHSSTDRHKQFLAEERMKSYPVLYELLSKFLKKLEFGTLLNDGIDPTLSREDIIKHLKNIESWDSQQAFLLTEWSAHLLFMYRHRLYEIIDLPRDVFQAEFAHRSVARQKLIEQTRELETVIRNEVGTNRSAILSMPRQQKNSIKKRRGQYNFSRRQDKKWIFTLLGKLIDSKRRNP